MNKLKIFIISCIEQCRGDDLYRAQCTFKYYTPEQMNEKYGLSDETPQQIIDGYVARNAECDEAIKAVKESNI